MIQYLHFEILLVLLLLNFPDGDVVCNGIGSIFIPFNFCFNAYNPFASKLLGTLYIVSFLSVFVFAVLHIISRV